MSDTIDHAALEAAARAATQGEWHYDRKDPAGQAVVSNEHIELMTFWHHSVGAIEKEMEANAAYIVAAQPSVILALLEERKRLVADVATIRANRDALARGEAAALQLMAIEKARATAAEAERDRMKAGIQADMWWDPDGADEMLHDPADYPAWVGGEEPMVFRLWCGVRLPDAWFTATFDEDEGWTAVEHNSEAEALAALAGEKEPKP